MRHRNKRDAQSVELRAAGMTLAQISRSTGQRPRSRTALVVLSLVLFGSAGAAGSYLAFGQRSDGPASMAAVQPEALPSVEPAVLEAQPPTPPTLSEAITSEPEPEDVFASSFPAPAPLEVDVTLVAVEAPEAIIAAETVPPVATPTPAPGPALVTAEPIVSTEGQETFATTDCVESLDAIAASIVVPFQPYAVETDRAALNPVVNLARQASDCEAAYIVVAGHADPSGDETQNLVLSWQRAEFVVAQLTQTGFEADRLEAIGFGSRRPLSEGSSGDDDTLNRRVDFAVRAALP